MINPVFFVDGLTEKKVIQKICPKVPIKLTLCNGKDVKLEMMATKIASSIRLLNNRYYPIIILVDRENRSESVEQIQAKLHSELSKTHKIDIELMIAVCDRMIENWMLADIENIKKHINKTSVKIDIIDGCHGKAKLKKILPSYHETTDGVDILTKSNPVKLYENSPSFKTFCHTIKSINCKWMNEISLQ